MTAIFQAELWCDDCADKIKRRLAEEMFNREGCVVLPDGMACIDFDDVDDLDGYLRLMGEFDYDSDDYPKDCVGSDESDRPEHCAGCKVFLENDLTAEGVDYVRSLAVDAYADEDENSVAFEYLDYYSYIELPGECDRCIVCDCLSDGIEDELCPKCYAELCEGDYDD